MHKTTAAAGARRVRAQQQPKARAFSTPTQCRLALAAVVLHDVGSWLARAAKGRARHPRPATRGTLGRPRAATHGQRPAGRADVTTSLAQKRGERGTAEGCFPKTGLARPVHTTNHTHCTEGCMKAAITIYVLQGGYKEDFLTALAHIKQKQN